MTAIRDVEPGEIYHFGSRGSNGELVYFDDHDYGSWQRLAADIVRAEGWEIYSFVQMPNHFHMLARVAERGLSPGMQRLNSTHSRRTNARRERTAHLFRQRFWSRHVESQEQLLTAIGYVAVNPYKGDRRIHPRDWRFGSYRGLAGYEEPPSFVAVDEVLRLFAPRPEIAVARYRDFVETAMARVDMARAQSTMGEPQRPPRLST